MNENGFTLVEGLLIGLILLILGFGGYYVWDNQTTLDESENPNELYENCVNSGGELTEITGSKQCWLDGKGFGEYNPDDPAANDNLPQNYAECVDAGGEVRQHEIGGHNICRSLNTDYVEPNPNDPAN